MAAALAVAGFTFVPSSFAANAGPATAPSVVHAVAGSASSSGQTAAAADAHIAGVIDRLTQAAITPGGMSNLVANFADLQRAHLTASSGFAQGYGQKLDARIKSVNQKWQQKYGHAFSISKAQILSPSFASITTRSATHGNAMDSASVDIKGSTTAIPLRVSLVCQKQNDYWKVTVPDSLTAANIRDNLLAQLTSVENQYARWPVSETDAYRMVSDHVLAAVLNKPNPVASALVSPAQPVANATPAQPAPVHHWWHFW